MLLLHLKQKIQLTSELIRDASQALSSFTIKVHALTGSVLHEIEFIEHMLIHEITDTHSEWHNTESVLKSVQLAIQVMYNTGNSSFTLQDTDSDTDPVVDYTSQK